MAIDCLGFSTELDLGNSWHDNFLLDGRQVGAVLGDDGLNHLFRGQEDVSLALATAESQLVSVLVRLRVGASDLFFVVVGDFLGVAKCASVLA